MTDVVLGDCAPLTNMTVTVAGAKPVTQLEHAAFHYRNFCSVLGIDLDRPDTKGTPERVAKMFIKELLSGTRSMPFKFTMFPIGEAANQLVSVCGIRFNSMCAHHHQPISGLCHVCYLPGEKIAGLSKLPRAVKWLSRRPVMQENLTHEILTFLVKQLKPHFAGVRMIAMHGCMYHRGIEDADSRTITEAFYADTGLLHDYESTKQEFLRSVSEWFQARGLT